VISEYICQISPKTLHHRSTAKHIFRPVNSSQNIQYWFLALFSKRQLLPTQPASKMRTAAVLASALSVLSSTASGRIVGIAAPKTVAAGSTAVVDIMAENYIQSIQNVAIAFGIEHGTAIPESLGQLLTSKYLGPDDSNIVGNITAHIQIPATLPKGKAVLTAFLFSLEGAAYEAVTETFQLTTTVGKFTSSGYVRSS